jgi:hypothetical protein
MHSIEAILNRMFPAASCPETTLSSSTRPSSTRSSSTLPPAIRPPAIRPSAIRPVPQPLVNSPYRCEPTTWGSEVPPPPFPQPYTSPKPLPERRVMPVSFRLGHLES